MTRRKAAQATRREPAKITQMHLDSAAVANDAAPMGSFKRYEPLPGVIPKEKETAALAMDATPYDAINAMYAGTEYSGFRGYPAGGTTFTGHARSGIGGSATGGNLYNSKGGIGSPAIITQGIPSGGNGGASQLSGSESGAGASGGSGTSGTLGSGGSGAAQAIGSGGFGGGAGGDGIVIIWEYA